MTYGCTQGDFRFSGSPVLRFSGSPFLRFSVSPVLRFSSFTPLPPFVIIFFLPLSLRVFTHQISQTTIFSCFGIIYPFFFLIIMFLYNFLLIFPLFSPFLYIFFNFSLLFSFYFVIVLFYLSFFFSNIISEAFFLPGGGRVNGKIYTPVLN